MPRLEIHRDLVLEAEVLRSHCRGASDTRAARRLTALAQQRAHPGPILTPEGRSFRTELHEELADGGNYTAWGLQAGEFTPEQAAKIAGHLRSAFLVAGG